MSNGLIVCLVGFPGVGKLTIAKSLARMSGATIVDNHWINDPILRLVAKDGSTAVPDAVWPQVAKVRGAVLDTISTLAPPGASFIFTLAGSNEDPEDRRAFEEYLEVAARRGSRFVAVRLLCGEEELAKRITSPERHGRKLVDPIEAVTNVRAYSPLDPRVPGALTLDVTNLAADTAATTILAHVNAGSST
jgi:predicted kinase